MGQINSKTPQYVGSEQFDRYCSEEVRETINTVDNILQRESTNLINLLPPVHLPT